MQAQTLQLERLRPREGQEPLTSSPVPLPPVHHPPPLPVAAAVVVATIILIIVASHPEPLLCARHLPGSLPLPHSSLLGRDHLPSLSVQESTQTDLPRLNHLTGSGAGFERESDSEICALFKKLDHLIKDPSFIFS